MAIGDAATAAGLTVWNAAQDRRLGYQNDNQRGDDIAAVISKLGFIATSAALRDGRWGTPTTATARLALQNLAPITRRTDKGRTEQYFAAIDDGGVGTNPAGRTVAGWYHIAGKPEIGVFVYASGYADSSAGALTTVEKSNGFVTLVLCASKAGTVGNGDLVGTLPVGFRPRPTQSRVDFAGGSNTGSIQNYIARDNGIVNVYSPLSSPTGVNGSATFRALDAPVVD